VVLGGLPGLGATPRAAGQSGGTGEPTPQTDASVPATRVTMFGASPAEANDETWGLGLENGDSVLVRYTPESGWSLAPKLLDADGQPLTGFRLDQPEAFKYDSPSPLAGQMTAHGGGLLAGSVTSGGGEEQVLLVRNPGGSFQEAPLPKEGGAALAEHERLLGVNRAPLVAALEEAGGQAGALVVPVDEETGQDTRVLHWDGKEWTSEPIEVPAANKGEFQVLAIGASSPGNAWLLAKLSSHYPAGSVALFRRRLGKEGEVPSWQPVTVKSGGEAGEPLAAPPEGRPFTVPNRDQAQLLTVTGEGVWIDGQRSDIQASTTMFFKPEGETAGHVPASWCKIPEGSSPEAKPCTHELPEALPTSGGRSFAWANSSTSEGLGERVISGFPSGVSLRLEGTAFKRVLALGGTPGHDVGGAFGSAFSNPREGWLGQELLPVHLTLNPVGSRLSPWPASFRHALLALAPAPGQPVGSLSSEALAVGDNGEVARYTPGEGWLPESLLGPGERHEVPRLRAVAWPTPTRAYAVGDEGQMWLWRGETNLWEQDPATPLNFRGNLLGIAFEPENRYRGYAVGQGGVLLSYGKTWTQEPEAAIPSQARGASFTSIAFAGSEAIVAYRKLVPSTDRFEGGLIVNSGSGWHVDEGAAKVAEGNVPWAVAGLPDGGAAFSAEGEGEGGQIYERQSPGAPWLQTPTPYPGDGSPGSISLFREGGALRVVAVGSIPLVGIIRVESEPSSPPGFPPPIAKPYPLEPSQAKGVLRQTASGWSDEEHELNDVEEPPGEYKNYDTVYQPDPVAAVLVDPTGSAGWAVGGIADDETAQTESMDTSDVWRYPADGSTPPGVGTAPIATEATAASFAIGGGSQCAAPCADRARAAIGPDVWMSHALSVTQSIPHVRAFLDTGPRVTTGKTAGPATLPVPYERELERYAEVLGSSSMHTYVAASPTDLDGAHSEAGFELAFAGFPEPFGKAPAAPELEFGGRSSENCAGTAGCQAAYYALNTSGSGGRVRVIVLDTSTEVGPTQLAWIEEELRKARTNGEPAIAVGNADLPAQIAAGDDSAVKVGTALVNGGASAYFFDAPGENLHLPIQAGGRSIESYGSGTLGYELEGAQQQSDFIGASGFLLVQINVKARNTSTNVAPVKVELIPNVGELALEAEQGTLLRRSEYTLFDALARRPRSGNEASNRSTAPETDPYIPIPAECVGATCPETGGEGILPEYSFTSSKPSVGGFVKRNKAVSGLTVLQQANGEPEREPEAGSKSGLFCAYNPGTTTVTISAGGLSASLPVTVQNGSVRQPCGTVPSGEKPLGSQEAAAAAPPPPPAPAPATAPLSSSTSPPLPVPPVPAATTPTSAPVPKTPQPTPFFVPQPLAAFVPAFVPAPIPTPARPTPPTGTSAVTSPVEAPEREEESEAAPESVSNEAVAYRSSEHEPSPAYILGVVLLAALAGASIRRRPRRGEREIRVAPATISTMRSQRQISRTRGRGR
jgi:hypothetical protein